MSGMQATIGILAALQHRARTGEGQLVEVNLLSTALSGMVNQSSAWVAGGDVPNRMGNAHPSLFPYEPLPRTKVALPARSKKGAYDDAAPMQGRRWIPTVA